MITTLLLTLILQALPVGKPAPVKVCTIAGLKLATTAMTDSASWTRAQAKWGAAAWQRRTWRGGETVVEIGTLTPLGWPQTCPSSTCWQSKDGSWRTLWNALMIEECQRQQGPPVSVKPAP